MLTITDVRAHPGDGAYLLDNGTTAVLYDTGFGFTGYAVADKIADILGDRPLDAILLTHSHYDHALGSAYISRRYPDAKIYAAGYAAKIFAKPTARQVMRDLDRKCACNSGVSEYTDLIDELHVDIPVEDGDEITVGDLSFTVIALPGHTRCSVGFYLASEKLLLSSETLGVYDGDKTIVPSFLIGYETTLASIEKAEALEIETILLPHIGPQSKDKTAFYLANMKKSAVFTAESIAEILRSGGTKDDAIRWFRDTFYHGYVVDIYPEDAMLLNTGIMIDLIGREFFPQELSTQ